MSILGNRAGDIAFNNTNDFIEAIGYLAAPGRIEFLEAEVPDDGRHLQFESEFPGQRYRAITQGTTSGGNPMKYTAQFRVYLLSVDNCPVTLRNSLGVGRGNSVARINKAAFVERLVRHFGFVFGYGTIQDALIIRNATSINYPAYINDFDRGYNL